MTVDELLSAIELTKQQYGCVLCICGSSNTKKTVSLSVATKQTGKNDEENCETNKITRKETKKRNI